MSSIVYDHRFQPSEEVIEKLLRSRREVENMTKRDLKCPICGFRIIGAYADRIGHAEVKCRKCKFEGPVNLSYFRRQERNHYYVRFDKKRKDY